MPNLSLSFIIFLTIRSVRVLRLGQRMGFEQRNRVSRTGHRAAERVHDQFTDGIDLIRIGHP